MVFPHSMGTAPGFGFPQNTQSMGMGPNGTHPSKNGFSQKSGFGRKNVSLTPFSRRVLIAILTICEGKLIYLLSGDELRRLILANLRELGLQL